MRYLLAFLVSLLVLPSLVSAADYYVAKSGGDYSTIQAALNSAQAGDTIYVRAGTYNERLTITRSGNPTAGYITLRNYPGEKPVLSGAGLGNGEMIQGTHISYFKVIGLHVKDHTGAGIAFYGGGSHLEIRDNEISDQSFQTNYGHCIHLSPTTGWPFTYYDYTDVIVDGNYIHDVETGTNSAYNEALTFEWGVSRFRITNNTLERVSHIGIDLIGKNEYMGAPSRYPHDGIIRGNTVRDSGSLGEVSGIYVDGARNVVIEQNKVYDYSGNGIVTSAEDCSFTAGHIIIRYNEVWNNPRNILLGSVGGSTACQSPLEKIRIVHNVVYADESNRANFPIFAGYDILAKNNIASNIAGNANIEHSYGEGSPTLDYNCYNPSNAYYQYNLGGPYWDFANYVSNTGQDENSLVGNPLFVNAAGRDFFLQSTSPCIDQGDFLTRTTSSGTGNVITVTDSDYFFDGYGIEGLQGDLVKIGSNSPVRITDVDYQTNTITVATSISWNAGDGVSYPYSGSKPDMGAYEYGEEPSSCGNSQCDANECDTCSQDCGFSDCCPDGTCNNGETQSSCPSDCGTPQQTCSQMGGMDCCTAGETCPGSSYTGASDCSGVCCSVQCQQATQTCSQQGGDICLTTETCPGSWLTASDSERCCSQTCQPGTVAMTVIYVDSEETSGEDGSGSNAVDNDPDTIWHTQWLASSPPHPHEIQIDLGATKTISGFSYLPRQVGINGNIADYEFYVSDSATNWGNAVVTGTFDSGSALKTVNFAATSGRYIRLVADSEINGNPWTSAAEINIIEAAQQYHRADTSPQDGCITMGELTAFIELWLTGQEGVTMPEMMGAVTLWRAGTGC